MKAAFLMASVSRMGGGVTEVARQLAWQLRSTPDVCVDAIGLHDDCTHEDVDTWPQRSVKTRNVVGPRGFGYAPGYCDLIREARADVLHCHGLWMYPSFAGLWVASARLPYVISPHGMLDPWAQGNSKWKKRLAGALFENAHLRGAGCLHALNTAELQAIRATGLKNPVCVVPNGVDLLPNRKTCRPDRIVLRTRPGQRSLLFLGRIHPKKGLDPLIDAWALIRSRAPQLSRDWVLAIAGWEGQKDYQSRLVARAVALGIDSAINFIGPLYGADKIAALQTADAFVLASLSEGMPMTILEAWAHELPVVMTPHCNLPEGFAAGAAIRIEPDVASIADGLESLLALSDAGRRSIGLNGRCLVERRFTWEKAAAHLLSVYQWLIGGGSVPECVDTPDRRGCLA